MKVIGAIAIASVMATGTATAEITPDDELNLANSGLVASIDSTTASVDDGQGDADLDSVFTGPVQDYSKLGSEM